MIDFNKVNLSDKRIQIGFRVIEGIIIALCGFFVLERCNMGGTSNVFSWIGDHPGTFFANLLIIYVSYYKFRGFSKRPEIPSGIYLLCIYFIGYANYYKLALRSDPAKPFDILSIGVVGDISAEYSFPMTGGLFLNLVFVIFVWAGIFFASRLLYREIIRGKKKKLLAGVSVFAICFILLTLFTSSFFIKSVMVEDVRYNQQTNYRRNGFALSTMMNLQSIDVEVPENYSKGNVIDTILEGSSINISKLGNPSEKPDIILVQMEAYADSTIYSDEISYTIDPFEPLNKYKEEIKEFNLKVSNIGGGTSETEYEVLTGASMANVPSGDIPFINHLKKPVESLVTDLESYGYDSMIVHPNKASFYNRDVVYPNLGFNNYYTLETFDDPKYVGYYVSDDSFADGVIKQYENAKKSDNPVFEYCVSIQNHGPFTIASDYEVNYGSLTVSDDQKLAMSRYGENMYDANEALVKLMDYFSNVDHPVIMIAYGDHQAYWTWANSLDVSYEDKLKTRGFVWSNYEISDLDKDTLCAYEISEYIFRYAGLKAPDYYKGLLVDRALISYDRIYGEDYLSSSKDEITLKQEELYGEIGTKINNLESRDIIESVKWNGQRIAVTVTEEDQEYGNLILVNDQYRVSKGYYPKDLVNLSNTLDESMTDILTPGSAAHNIDKEAGEHLIEMTKAASKDGITEFVTSNVFRDIGFQTLLHNNKIKYYKLLGYEGDEAIEKASYWVAKPYTSEHHTGLAIDIVSKDHRALDEDFKNTSQGQWIYENCWDFGYIIRYFLDKDNYTGVGNEPWHIRYCGLPHSNIVHDEDMCWEEYMDYIHKNQCFVYRDSNEQLWYVEYQRPDNTYIYVPDVGEDNYTISGDNIDGFIITVKVNEETSLTDFRVLNATEQKEKDSYTSILNTYDRRAEVTSGAILSQTISTPVTTETETVEEPVKEEEKPQETEQPETVATQTVTEIQ